MILMCFQTQWILPSVILRISHITNHTSQKSHKITHFTDHKSHKITHKSQIHKITHKSLDLQNRVMTQFCKEISVT